MIAVAHHQVAPTKDSQRWLDIFLWGYIVVLLFFSIFYAQERIVAYDTAVYMVEMIRSKGFFIATNRFIAVVAEVLPVAGITAGLPLKAVIILYSLNSTLIPVLCALACRYMLKDVAAAVAILLFYSIMSARLFYYPVSEFQMGLCLMLLYHSMVLFWIKKNSKLLLVFFLSLPIVVTVVFSHPLSIVVFFAWLMLMLSFTETRNWKLVVPAAIAATTYFLREHFFRAIVGTFDYEQQRRSNLDNFLKPISSYFHSRLASESWSEYTNHYFIIFALVILVLGLLIYKKKWLGAITFSLIIFSFWLLVTVSFGDWTYSFYLEHMYQPIGFFIALGTGYLLVNGSFHKGLKIGILSATAIISLSKLNSGHSHNRAKIDFYEPYIDYMLAHNIKIAALPRQYVPGNFDSYWAAHCETILVSGQRGPDAAILLYVHYSQHTLSQIDEDSNYYTEDYFNISKNLLPVLFDSIATPQQIDSLNKISKHNPDN